MLPVGVTTASHLRQHGLLAIRGPNHLLPNQITRSEHEASERMVGTGLDALVQHKVTATSAATMYTPSLRHAGRYWSALCGIGAGIPIPSL